MTLPAASAPAPAEPPSTTPAGPANAIRIGYARVSTRAQDHQLQMDALAAAHCREVVEETVSTRRERPKLAATIARMQPGDTLVIYKPDRIARSVKELLVFLEDELAPRGINLHILSGVCAGLHRPGGQSIADKMLFLVAAMAAEMERDLIRERTMDGLAAAAAQGRKGGRPPAIDADTLAAARARRARGQTIPAIAKALGVGRSTLYRAFEGDDPLVVVQRQEVAARPVGDGLTTAPAPASGAGPAVRDWERVRPAPRRLADGYRVARRSGDGRRYLLPPGSEVPIGYAETDGTRWTARTLDHERVEVDAVGGSHARQADALAALDRHYRTRPTPAPQPGA
ncbi:hypothetical protein Ppa06_64840 [Planomonospora parontospora subsp. parontospora]|uniref:Resolvase/invertase-type recombinase catalytic domain-containing protein n=2 Tax=Planomonospora parontospora TaxID=58119 RepID=A0AA37F838_9ACTN|nr:recombinase family protein [Planomonospora parontospora]GGK94378.1 hypothetical protein GCM10010126_62300 [Planomonospora parontospora]GII12686.1 hypothetical protein Ppa06_64840 [Planomonospora parontospora subsp. parontospora]